MIRVDPRRGSKQYIELIAAYKCPTTSSLLPFGDFAFEGSGPRGVVEIGVEVKDLQDFSSSYRNKRLQQQLRGMRDEYDVSILLITGVYTDEVNEASLFSLYFQAQVLTKTVETEDDAAAWVAKLYSWWQKPWDRHTSMKGLYIPLGQEESVIPVEPSPTRVCAALMPGIGWELSGRIAKIVKAPEDLFKDLSWMDKVPGIGEKKQLAILRWMRGKRG